MALSMMHDIRLPLLADGDLSGYLQQQYAQAKFGGLGLSLTAPQAVKKAHLAYAQAGAILVRTHTRNATLKALENAELSDKCEALYAGAAGLAQEAVGGRLRVMGELGPMGQQPLTVWERAYSERSVYLSDAGVDLFVLSHFNRLDEALVALRMIKRTSDAPVMAQLKFPLEPLPGGKVSAIDAGKQLLDEGADALGISCGVGEENLMRLASELMLLGVPVGVFLSLSAGQTPEAWANELMGLARQGVSMVGGCCGVMPEQIALLAQKIETH